MTKGIFFVLIMVVIFCVGVTIFLLSPDLEELMENSIVLDMNHNEALTNFDETKNRGFIRDLLDESVFLCLRCEPISEGRWDLEIYSEDVACKHGDIVPIIVTLTNMTNRVPLSKMVNLRRADGSFIGQGRTDNNGKFVFEYNVGDKAGAYLLKVTVNRDDYYNSDIHKFILTVGKADLALLMDNKFCTRGNVCKLTAKLCGQHPLSGETITFYQNGTKVGENKTNSEGIATYSYVCDIIGGDYPIFCQYNGNDYYNPLNASAQMHVYNWKTILTMNNITATMGEVVTLIVKLTKSINGEALINREIEFFDNDSNRIGTNITDDKGIARFSYQVPRQTGNYTLDAHFNAEKQYSCSDITAYLTINNDFEVVDNITNDTITLLDPTGPNNNELR